MFPICQVRGNGGTVSLLPGPPHVYEYQNCRSDRMPMQVASRQAIGVRALQPPEPEEQVQQPSQHDAHDRADQEYVEDCPVCCHPNIIHVKFDEDDDVRVWSAASRCAKPVNTRRLNRSKSNLLDDYYFLVEYSAGDVNLGLGDRQLSCECKHGVVFLQGRLFSFHEKQVAQGVVAGVSGVPQVVNEIQVE